MNNYEYGVVSGLGALYQFKAPLALSLELRNSLGVRTPFDKHVTLEATTFNLMVGGYYRFGGKKTED